jgi:acetyl-CoA carboxylase carboxyl transferase subunit alpha
MAKLKVPVIVTIIGEGGSGGALAIIGDQVLMLELHLLCYYSGGLRRDLWKRLWSS